MTITYLQNSAYMDYLVEEAKREMKRDDQYVLFRKSAPYIIVVIIIAVLIAAGGFTARYYYRVSQQAATERFFEAVNQEDGADKETALRAIATGNETPFAHIANIALMADKKEAEADVADIQTLPKPLASFAGAPVKAVEAESFERLAGFFTRLEHIDTTEEAEKLASDVAAEMQDHDAIWRHSLLELQAFALFRAKKTKEAGSIFYELSRDAQTPQAMRSRALELVDIIGADTISATDTDSQHISAESSTVHEQE